MNNYAKTVAEKPSAKKSTSNQTKHSLLFIIVFLCFGYLIINPDTVSTLSKNACAIAVFSVMPAAFPYLVLSGLTVNGGIADLVGKALSPLSKIFKLPPPCLCTIFISFISGFPVPSAIAYDLYRQGKCTLEDAEHICGFCSFCGPPFIISLFGARIMEDSRAGGVVFVVQCILSLILGKAFSINKKTQASFSCKNKKSTDPPLGVLICQSITEGGLSMLRIISFVIFFAIFSGFCENLVLWAFPDIPPIITSILRGFLEISAGITSLSQYGFSTNLKFILGSLYIYWSGISVFFQVSSSMGGAFSMKKYLIGRLFMILLGIPLSYFIYFYIIL